MADLKKTKIMTRKSSEELATLLENKSPRAELKYQ